MCIYIYIYIYVIWMVGRRRARSSSGVARDLDSQRLEHIGPVLVEGVGRSIIAYNSRL